MGLFSVKLTKFLGQIPLKKSPLLQKTLRRSFIVNRLPVQASTHRYQLHRVPNGMHRCKMAKKSHTTLIHDHRGSFVCAFLPHFGTQPVCRNWQSQTR